MLCTAQANVVASILTGNILPGYGRKMQEVEQPKVCLRTTPHKRVNLSWFPDFVPSPGRWSEAPGDMP